MEIKKQETPFTEARSATVKVEENEKNLHHNFPSWDLVPPHTPVRKGAEA